MARCFAVAMSQAPGLSGTPDSGHRSSAATRASCASSSARPTSRTIRARPAMSRADSILQTASIARCASIAVTPTDHNIFYSASATRGAPRLPFRAWLLTGLSNLLTHAFLLLSELGSELGAEVRRLEHLANLDLGFGACRLGAALDPFDRL